MEAVEFINYIEAVEPRYPYGNYKHENLNRFPKDLKVLADIIGVRYDLPYQSKVELWGRFRDTACRLKESTGIDYINYEIPLHHNHETYSEETIQGFIASFPKLSIVLQRHFLNFFEKKYMETAQTKFKQLHFKGSIPYTQYKKRYSFFALLSLHIKNKLRKFKKQILGD